MVKKNKVAEKNAMKVVWTGNRYLRILIIFSNMIFVNGISIFLLFD
ncbi:MAG: hypothetical protein ACRECH_08970 [Nitrososphaerales archaeon]